MEYEIGFEKQLINELINLWIECSIRCEKIEELSKKINEKRNI